jgi:hypothetical protein
VKATTKDFLNLFFNPNETICFSANQFAYPSEPQENISEDLTVLVAINPINGNRCDQNVTAYRTFLVECDDMSLDEQLRYIKEMEFPYSYCCFSGGKSLHFALVLDHDIPSEHIYRHTYQWILNILKKADQKTKNPSRCIRFPGSIRPDTGKEQKMVHMGGRISLDRLSRWLNKYPQETPKPLIKRPKNNGNANVRGVKLWAKKALKVGVHNMEGGRNQTWMSIGCEFALNGFNLDDTIYYLSKYFEEQSDFREREWLTSIKSGWHYADRISSKRRLNVRDIP